MIILFNANTAVRILPASSSLVNRLFNFFSEFVSANCTLFPDRIIIESSLKGKTTTYCMTFLLGAQVFHHYYSNSPNTLCILCAASSQAITDTTSKASPNLSLSQVEVLICFSTPADLSSWLSAILIQCKLLVQAISHRSTKVIKTLSRYLSSSSSSSCCFYRPLPVPRLNIAILVVGTRGDVQPFCLIGKRLARDGHNVLVATHANFRSFVVGFGLGFFPLAGDPKKLSDFMVRYGGNLIKSAMEGQILSEIPEYMTMLADIMASTFPACSSPDGSFIADAIISNPVTYGHVHVAEALHVPIHIMFPQPWIPTKAFPHPLLASSIYSAAYLSGMRTGGASNSWSQGNRASYELMDRLLWSSIEVTVNHFRENTLGLKPIRRGEHGHTLLQKVPFSGLWSPALVPRPKDWRSDLCDVVGTVFDTSVGDGVSGMSTGDETRLMDWIHLNDDRLPIFIGFGSMVIENQNDLAKMIVNSATSVKCRVILQSSWTELSQSFQNEDVAGSSDILNRHVCFIGSCNHDWLFKYVCGVVHHGGAGTTAAGLRFGKPTWILPFFGDQFFWAKVLFDAGVSPRPVPFSHLNEGLLRDGFSSLWYPSDHLKARCLNIGSILSTMEDGVEGAVESFYRHLPRKDLLCEVAMFNRAFNDPAVDVGHNLAWVDPSCRLPDMISELTNGHHFKLSMDYLNDMKTVASVARTWIYCMDDASRSMRPVGPLDGVVQAVGGVIHEFSGGIVDLAWKDLSLRKFLNRQLIGGQYAVQKIVEGLIPYDSQVSIVFNNAVSAQSEDMEMKTCKHHHDNEIESGRRRKLCSLALASMDLFEVILHICDDHDEENTKMFRDRHDDDSSSSLPQELLTSVTITRTMTSVPFIETQDHFKLSESLDNPPFALKEHDSNDADSNDNSSFLKESSTDTGSLPAHVTSQVDEKFDDDLLNSVVIVEKATPLVMDDFDICRSNFLKLMEGSLDDVVQSPLQATGMTSRRQKRQITHRDSRGRLMFDQILKFFRFLDCYYGQDGDVVMDEFDVWCFISTITERNKFYQSESGERIASVNCDFGVEVMKALHSSQSINFTRFCGLISDCLMRNSK